MKFWQAMKIVDEGGKVRRKDWGNYLSTWTYSIYFWEKLQGEWYPMHQADDCLTSNDMMAEDWEVVDPTPTGRAAIEEGLMELRIATRPKFSDYHKE